MPWSYLFHIPFAICITNFSVEIYQNFAYCQVFEEAKHVKAHNITFYLAEYFILLAEICIFQFLKLYVQQLIKCLTKVLLQADGKCPKNHPSKRCSEGQTSAVRGIHMGTQQCLTWWEEALQVVQQWQQLGIRQGPGSAAVGPQVCGVTHTHLRYRWGTTFSLSSLEEDLIMLFLHRAEAKLEGKEAPLSDVIQWGTASGAQYWPFLSFTWEHSAAEGLQVLQE